MMTSHRRKLFWSLITICVLSLADTAFASEQNEDIIRLATFNANYREGFLEVAEKYEKLHPHVTVDVSIVENVGFKTWIRTRFAAGGDLVPDLYNGNWTPGYGELGKWVPLNGYLDAISPYTGKLWRDSFDMPLLEQRKIAGTIYMVALDYIEIAIFYNREIFEELGLTVPATWEDLLETCETIRQAGLTPMAISGSADSFYSGDMAWLIRVFNDAYLRSYIPLVMSRPGDWDYDADRNKGFTYDANDPLSDLMVVMNGERSFNALLDGSLDLTDDRFKQIYIKLKELSQYFPEGYLGSDVHSALQMFYQQKAAMILLHSGNITSIVQDFKKMSERDRFEFGNFWFPPITTDPLFCGSFRGVGGTAVSFAVTQKNDPAHEKNVVDFLQFMSAPENVQLILELALENEKPIHGPPVVKGVHLPPELAEQYEVFKGHGFEKIYFQGLNTEQESLSEWTVLAQEFLGDRLSLDDFCEQNKAAIMRALDRLTYANGYDLDPTTKDDPPVYDDTRSLWNPFENGSLMVLIIILLFGGYAFYNIRRARGPVRARAVAAYTLLFPTFLLLGLFNYFPSLSGLYHAFTEWEEGRVAVFNGLDNFKRLATDTVLYRGIMNMIIMMIASLFKATVVPFAAAEMILFVINDRLRYVLRTLFLLPMVVPGMVGILIWRGIYNPTAGLLNQSLRGIGLSDWTQSWLGEPALALPSIIFMGFPWVGAFGLLIYMAGLMSIPSAIYESYRLESESICRRILNIDIPLVRGQFRLLVILAVIGSLQDFHSILLITNGGPGLATTVPALRMYHTAFTFTHYGYGASIGFVLFLVMLTITMINLKVIKKAEVD
ncbi:extracellular solute-binding protein [Candidatus Hydrogenedentota bacterium]